MPKTIKQKIVFKNTKPKDLYDLYMDSKKHSMPPAHRLLFHQKRAENIQRTRII